MYWQRNLPDPVPARIPHDDNSVDEVRLECTINRDPVVVNYAALLVNVHRVLRPGGVVRLHGFAVGRPYPDELLSLPGQVAAVQCVSVENEPLAVAGFVGVTSRNLLNFEKSSAKAFFNLHRVAMPEMLNVTHKSGHRPRAAQHIAIYRGSLASVADDLGNVFRRGERVLVNIDHGWC